MLKTRICDLLGIELPIVSAGMGGVALSRLAAAVSEAGGLGTIALAGFTPDAIHDEISAARGLTSRPIAVNLLVPFILPGVLEAVMRAPVNAITLFWGDPAEWIPKAKGSRAKVIWQCGSAAEAQAAARAGADAIIAQGFEAGGHVRGTVTTLALIPEVRDAIGDLPMLAAGGFADGRGLAAALALGADGAVFGTRFVAAEETAAHPVYKARVTQAHAADTLHTTLYDIGWPNAPHRVIRTAMVEEWERAGRPATGKRPGEGQKIATMRGRGVEVDLVRYAVNTPSSYVEGEIEALPFYAGQSCTQVRDIMPAAQIVRRIASEAREVISARLAPLAS
ncbi:MAG: NAD(P)H-dependent flavin oxidoreductase [Candidatus Binatales bacterium]